jgi:hypothetical protein
MMFCEMLVNRFFVEFDHATPRPGGVQSALTESKLTLRLIAQVDLDVKTFLEPRFHYGEVDVLTGSGSRLRKTAKAADARLLDSQKRLFVGGRNDIAPLHVGLSE